MYKLRLFKKDVSLICFMHFFGTCFLMHIGRGVHAPTMPSTHLMSSHVASHMLSTVIFHSFPSRSIVPMHRHIRPCCRRRRPSYSKSCTGFQIVLLYPPVMYGGLIWKRSQKVNFCSLPVRSEASTLAYSSMMI